MALESDLAMRNRMVRACRWVLANRKRLNAWLGRVVSFYFGYRLLHHEVYEKETAEPLLVFLGLWLCGIAPASFFDGIRRVTDTVGGDGARPTSRPESKDKQSNEEAGP